MFVESYDERGSLGSESDSDEDDSGLGFKNSNSGEDSSIKNKQEDPNGVIKQEDSIKQDEQEYMNQQGDKTNN